MKIRFGPNNSLKRKAVFSYLYWKKMNRLFSILTLLCMPTQPYYLVHKSQTKRLYCVSLIIKENMREMIEVYSIKKNPDGILIKTNSLEFDCYRIVFLFVLLFGSLFHWHFKTALISNLSVEVPKVPFQNMYELIIS